MAKYSIVPQDIKEYLKTDKEFQDIHAFCGFLKRSDKEPDIKVNLKKMLIEKVLKENKEEVKACQKRYYDDNVGWIQSNCRIEGEAEAREGEEEKAKAQADAVPGAGAAYENIRIKFEQSDYCKVKPLEEDDVDYSASIEFREGGIINLQSNVRVFVYNPKLKLDVSRLLLVEEEGNQVLAAGRLVPVTVGEESLQGVDEYWVVFEDKGTIAYRGLEDIKRARYVFYGLDGQPYSRLIEIAYKPYNIEKERPLCIDFGTSNTTAGSYGILDRKNDRAEIVCFTDVTVTPNNTKAMLLPTVVYVEDCSDKNSIKYLFGYEARKRIEEEHYESKASVYYEIKRWMAAADEEEEIRDNNNNTARPLKKDIIKAYIDYVIENAEHYFSTRFEKIHFSAPVKQKEKFIEVFTQLYGSGKVLSAQESIDEGIAIVYNQIITLLDAQGGNKNQGEEKKSIMVMDCGGGTTDLASCEYVYRETTIGKELRLDTCFENGNANFGGNNITYRIMQLLKIKIAAILRKGYIDCDGEAIGIISMSENEILGLAETQMKNRCYDSDREYNKIYEKFLENYNRAEEIIPTQYVDNRKYTGVGSLKKIRRNFYYLWRQAEHIKIEFYKTERVLINFGDIQEDAAIKIKTEDNYYLYVSDEDSSVLRKEGRPFEKVQITIKEINRVICGDIYSLLVGLFQNGKLTSREKKVEDFNYYKLSGQSCKISLFFDLLKEYIPGRKLRPAIGQESNAKNQKSEDMKLDCVLGSISYVRDQILPGMKVILNSGKPEQIYHIYLKGHLCEDKKLFSCDKPNEILFDISNVGKRQYPLKVVGKDNVCEREFIFELKEPAKDGDYQNTEDIKKKLLDTTVVNSDGIDKFMEAMRSKVRDSGEPVNIVFVVPAKAGYGIKVGQIRGQSTEDGSKYQLLQYKDENFEDASKTFFNGRR